MPEIGQCRYRHVKIDKDKEDYVTVSKAGAKSVEIAHPGCRKKAEETPVEGEGG